LIAWPGATIWGRLLLAVAIIGCIAAVLLGAGMALVFRAERDFAALARDSIPRVALAGELAEFTGTLAALSAGIIAGTRNPVDAPDLPEAQVAAVARGIVAVLAAPALQGVPQAEGLASAEAELRTALTGVLALSANGAALDLRLQDADEQLRWTQVDLQDQAAALLDDLSFNMDSSLQQILAESRPTLRARSEAMLVADRQLRDRLQRLSADSATLAALVLQARAADDMATLEQVERIAREVLDAIILGRAGLPDRIDVTLLLEGLDRMVALAQGTDSVIALMRTRISLRDDMLVALADAQRALVTMQAHLTELGQAERAEAQAAADTAARRMLDGAKWMAVLSIVGASVGLAILLLFVHKRIIRRIRQLTEDLVQIADAEMPPIGGLDEIARMGHAVAVFRTSVAELHAANDNLAVEVAERRRAVERLERTQRDLVQAGKMAALGQMSAAISHEINQPLAAMQHRLHALRRAHPDAAEAANRLQALATRITGTISRLRRIARRADYQMKPVRLAEPISSVLDLLEHRLQATETVLEGMAMLNDVAVMGDEILIEQVLLNVLGNALDAIAETGAPGRIKLDVQAGDDVELCITDTGPGLRGRSGADLVDPFFTTKEIGKGLGLGLSIAFNVMQDMGGFLAISEGPQGGAHLRLRFRSATDKGPDHG
jgi:C4-dicarboxylate-specific signal transduction histidine kinase